MDADLDAELDDDLDVEVSTLTIRQFINYHNYLYLVLVSSLSQLAHNYWLTIKLTKSTQELRIWMQKRRIICREEENEWGNKDLQLFQRLRKQKKENWLCMKLIANKDIKKNKTYSSGNAIGAYLQKV